MNIVAAMGEKLYYIFRIVEMIRRSDQTTYIRYRIYEMDGLNPHWQDDHYYDLQDGEKIWDVVANRIKNHLADGKPFEFTEIE